MRLTSRKWKLLLVIAILQTLLSNVLSENALLFDGGGWVALSVETAVISSLLSGIQKLFTADL